MGIIEDIKGIFTEKTIVGLGYATVSGLASAVLGGVFEKASNENKYMGYAGNIVGAGLMAWIAEKMGHPEWKGYAVFGALFPPVWQAVTEKINPDEMANKVAGNLGLTWHKAAMSVPTPTTVVVEAAQPAPAQPQPQQEEIMI